MEQLYNDLLFFAGNCFLDQCIRKVLELSHHLRKVDTACELALIGVF
jgi:hypothetical protein